MCMSSRRQSGFSLLELIIFIVVVSVGIAGILMVMDVSVKSSADPMVRKQTVAAAESLLEEILLKEYANPVGGYVPPAPAPNPVRAPFDDVGDYAGYTTTGGMKDITNNSAIAGLTNYNVSSVTVAAPTLNGVDMKQVTVTVNGPAGAISLTGYRSNY
jgi:MSHA pilin protein MshD